MLNKTERKIIQQEGRLLKQANKKRREEEKKRQRALNKKLENGNWLDKLMRLFR